MTSWIDVLEAWERIERHVQPLAAERVPLAESVGRVVAQPIHTDRDYPPFDRAAMDGFAVRSRDVVDASVDRPVELRVVDESTPGRECRAVAEPGTCVRIMTGAPVPRGWDAIVPVETTSGFDRDPVQIHAASDAGRHIAAHGSERRAHELLFAPGQRLGPADVGMLAMIGVTELDVTRRPRTAVLSTGNELVPHDRAPHGAQIRNSNAPMLQALAAPDSDVDCVGTAADARANLAAAVSRGLMSDLLLVTGGVSMGAYDLVGESLLGAGVRVHFDRVALQPGKPALFGTHPGGVVLALPGNPVSALTTFRLFAVPVLRRLQGARVVRPRWGRARARFSWTRRSPTKWILLPGRLVEGGAAVERVPYAGSGDLLAYARADCQIVLPPNTDALVRGAEVRVWPL